MLSKVDPKLIAALTLVLGLIIGYYADNSLISRPQIEALTDQTATQQERITVLETQLNSLESDIDALQTQYEELETNTQQTIEEQESQIISLENQIQPYLNLIDDQEENLANLTSQLNELEEDYTDLQEQYNEIYNPLYTEFEINELQFKLTVLQDEYSDNNPIEGTVEIYYTDGSPFRGTFKLNLYKIYVAAGSLSDAFDLRGATDYKWISPFVLGPGSYRLSLSDIKDRDGETMVINSELRDYPIYVLMG